MNAYDVLKKYISRVSHYTVETYKKILTQDSGLLFAFFIVILVWAINANSIAWLDAAWELAHKELLFYRGDFKTYLDGITFDHPLGRLFVLTLFLKIFGLHAFATTLPGMLLNLAAVFSIFSLCKRYGSINSARIAAILLACDPIFIATSLHTLPDHYFTAIMLVACYAYASNRMILWSVALIAIVLNKETALLLIFAFIGQWVISIPFFLKEKKKIHYERVLIPILALIIFQLYIYISEHYFNHARWTYAGSSGFSSAWDNLVNITVKLRKLWSGNWTEHLNLLNLTVFNFQWIINILAYWWFTIIFFDALKAASPLLATHKKIQTINIVTMFLIAGILFWLAYFVMELTQYIIPFTVAIILPSAYFLSELINIKIKKINTNYFSTPLLAIIMFVIAYICLVSTYDTFATPRYSLPVTVFLIIPAALFVDFLSVHIGKGVRLFLYAMGFLIMTIRFFSSIDPVTDRLSLYHYPGFDKVIVHGELIYLSRLGVMDTAVYNGQYLIMVSRRTALIRAYANGHSKIAPPCNILDDAQWRLIENFTNFDWSDHKGDC